MRDADTHKLVSGLAAITAWRRARADWVPGADWPVLVAFGQSAEAPKGGLEPLLAEARRVDGQELLRRRRVALGFTRLSDSVLLEEFEHYFAEDDEDDVPSAELQMILGDEDDDEMERQDLDSEDAEFERQDDEDDEDFDVSNTGTGADIDDEPLIAPEPLDPWGQLLALPEFAAGDPGRRALRLQRVPVEKSWQAALFLPVPQGTDLEPVQWAAILRYWETQRGAELICTTPDRAFLVSGHLPSNRSDARRLAEEHLALESRSADAGGRLMLRRRLRFLSKSRLWALPTHG